MAYKVEISEKAYRSLASIPEKQGKQIVKRIYKLADNQRPPGSKKMKGAMEGHWRIRVGDYRVIYQIKEEILIISVIDVGHRKDIYRKV